MATLKASFPTKIFFNTLAGQDINRVCLQAHEAGYTMFHHNGEVFSVMTFMLIAGLRDQKEHSKAKLFNLTELMDYYS